MIDTEDAMKVQAQGEAAGQAAPSQPEAKPARQFADPIDEDALHDQLMIAMMSEEPAHAGSGLPDRAPEEGRGMAFELNDPIIRGKKPPAE